MMVRRDLDKIHFNPKISILTFVNKVPFVIVYRIYQMQPMTFVQKYDSFVLLVHDTKCIKLSFSKDIHCID
jgi:hypothetical protein